MAMHEIPQDGTDHQPSPDCPCRPTVSKTKRLTEPARTIYAHRERTADTVDVDGLREAECGHLVVDGEHHDIPDDGAPHAPTTECGCGPQLATGAGGHAVYVHTDQGSDAETEQIYREVFGT